MEKWKDVLRAAWGTEGGRFIVVGGSIAVIQAILLAMMVEIGGYEKIEVNRWLQPIMLTISFFPHREITWKEKKGKFFRDAAFYYPLRIVITVFNTYCFEFLLTAVVWFPYVAINPSLMVVEAFLNFLAGKYIIYRKSANA